ncbi:transcription initiation factor TFIID subunit 6-like [Watersipora subatra]|uniref:transcription initiation factor TFIID subunit 6-like n=1 Tax=Watersipora subatra TaxID=2589382 RepID=UPI00355C1BB4
MAESTKEVPPEVSSENVKVIAESVGISTATEDSFKFLAEDATFRLKTIIQDALKLASHSKRTNLTTHDVDFTLKMKHYEPLYGFTSSDYIPFRNASGGGRDIHFTDDKELDLDEVALKPLPKLPLQCSLKAHWLAIEGVQPAIPENPPPLSRDTQKVEGINPATKATGDKMTKNKLISKKSKDVRIKPLSEHDLSVEQQLLYKEITEACVGPDEPRRSEALASLAQDPGLHKILPRIATFISEGVKVNCVNHNLAILIYLMRMLKSLLDNSSLYMEKYLHELIPAVLTCIVSKQLCIKPESDNHWALRDFSSKILCQICRKFSMSTNDIQTRVVRVLSEALHNPAAALTTHYGCIIALSELGHGVMQSFVIPVVKSVTERARCVSEGAGATDENKITAQHIRTAFIKTVAPVLVVVRKPPDNPDAYKAEFGPIGTYILEAVVRLRSQNAGSSTSLLQINNPSRPVATIRTQSGLTVLAQPQSSVSRSFSLPMGARSVGSSQPSPGLRTPGVAQSLIRTPTTPNTPSAGQASQKVIIVSAGGPATPGSSLVKREATTSERYGTQSPQPMTLTKALTMQAKAEAQAAGGDQSPSALMNSSDSLY